MKKIISALMTALLTVSPTACGSSGSSAGDVKLPSVFLQYYSDGGLSAYGEYYYEFDKSGNIVKECYYSCGNLYETTERTYSSSGIIAGESVYGRGDKLQTYREFDEEGNLTKETTYNYKGDVDTYCEYNKDGNIIYKESFSYSHYIIRYEYDDEGNLSKRYEEDYDENDNIEFSYEDTIDSEGNTINRIITEANGTSYAADSTSYDARQMVFETDGNHRTVIEIGKDGEQLYRTEEDYDDNGNLLSSTTYVSYDDDRLLSHEEYVYDEEGRVIHEIYDFMDSTEILYEYADEGYLYKKTEITEKYISQEAYGDGSDAVLTECMTVYFYDEDGDKVRCENYQAGRLTSYSVWEFEYINPAKYKGRELDYREERKLDERAYIVY